MADVAYIPYIVRLRAYIKDYKEENPLLDKEENSDDSLQFAIEDALEYIGNSYQPQITYTVDNIKSNVPWYLVRDGAMIFILMSNMVNSARNLHSYADNGGVRESDQDTYGRYINIINVMKSRWEQEVKNFKAALNLAQGYGGVQSEMSLLYGIDTVQ